LNIFIFHVAGYYSLITGGCLPGFFIDIWSFSEFRQPQDIDFEILGQSAGLAIARCNQTRIFIMSTLTFLAL